MRDIALGCLPTVDTCFGQGKRVRSNRDVLPGDVQAQLGSAEIAVEAPDVPQQRDQHIATVLFGGGQVPFGGLHAAPDSSE